MVIFSLEMCLLSTPYLVQKPYYFNLGSIDIVLYNLFLKRRKVGCNIIMRRNNTNMSSGLLYLPSTHTKVCLHPLPTHTLSLLSLEATKAPVFVLQALLLQLLRLSSSYYCTLSLFSFYAELEILPVLFSLN